MPERIHVRPFNGTRPVGSQVGSGGPPGMPVVQRLGKPAGLDQLTPFFSKGVNGGFSRNLPLTLGEAEKAASPLG